MKPHALAIIAASLSISGAFAQSSPNFSRGQVPTAGQWNAAFASKQDILRFSPLNLAGGTMSGKLFTTPSTVNGAGLAILPGIAPTTPSNGDLWSTGVGLFGRFGSRTLAIPGMDQNTGALSVPGGPTLGTYQNGQFTSQPDALSTSGPVTAGTVTASSVAAGAVAVQGSGFTCAPGAPCEAGPLKVAFPSLATRTLLDRLLERPSVIDYGVDMTGATDSSAALAAALNSGKRVSSPCGTIRLVSTVNITAPALFDGPGNCLTLKYDAPAGAAVTPVIDIQKTSTGTRLDNFAVDHQANTKGYAPNTVYGGNIIASSAILVQADDTSITRAKVSNGFDNGIAVVQFAGTGYASVAGSPKRWSIRGARTFNNGVGSTPKAGAGIDIGTGSQGTVDDHVDVGSYGGFILDIGASAQGQFSNLTAIGTKLDPGLGYSYAFYIGSSGSTFTNLTAIEPAYSGLWLDGFADRTTINGLYVKASGDRGALLKGGNSFLSNVTINSPGYGKTAGTVDAVIIDSSASTSNNLLINGLSVQSEFNTARYGINRTGSGPATGAVLNASLGGAVTATNNLPGTFGVVDGAALGGAWTDYTPTVTTGSGSFTTVSASGSYRLVGKTLSIRIIITLNNVGTATDVSVSLPFSAKYLSVISGSDSAVNGKGVNAVVAAGGTKALVKASDGTSPLTNGFVLVLGGEYQIP